MPGFFDNDVYFVFELLKKGVSEGVWWWSKSNVGFISNEGEFR